MSKLDEKSVTLEKIATLNLLYREKSQELIYCNSLSKEMKIKEEMSRYEVQIKVLKRKMASWELESGDERLRG